MYELSTVEPAMSSHSYEQPTFYGRSLGNSPKWHFVYKCTSYEQPPAFNGHFFCVARVAAHSRFYCISKYSHPKKSFFQSEIHCIPEKKKIEKNMHTKKQNIVTHIWGNNSQKNPKRSSRFLRLSSWLSYHLTPKSQLLPFCCAVRIGS